MVTSKQLPGGSVVVKPGRRGFGGLGFMLLLLILTAGLLVYLARLCGMLFDVGFSNPALRRLTKGFESFFAAQVPFRLEVDLAAGFDAVLQTCQSQLAAIKHGKKEPVIRVGNLDPERDFTDVRDVAAAYLRLARDGRPGEGYLVCSGRSVSIRVLLDTLIELNGVPVEVVTDGNRMNPSDVPCLYGDYAKLERDTGWRPRIELRQSLADALADWYERLGVQ